MIWGAEEVESILPAKLVTRLLYENICNVGMKNLRFWDILTSATIGHSETVQEVLNG